MRGADEGGGFAGNEADGDGAEEISARAALVEAVERAFFFQPGDETLCDAAGEINAPGRVGREGEIAHAGHDAAGAQAAELQRESVAPLC